MKKFKNLVKEVKSIKESYEDDHAAAHELIMHADNDSHLHHSSHLPIMANLKKKMHKGTYDSDKAKKLWMYHADRAAQSYHKEHGSPGMKWHHAFPTSVRKAAAAHWEEHHRDELNEAFTPEENEVLEEINNSHRLKIKDEHISSYPESHHGVLIAKSQLYGHPYKDRLDVAPVGDEKNEITVPAHHINFVKEDVEQIDELKKSTYLSYATKAGMGGLEKTFAVRKAQDDWDRSIFKKHFTKRPELKVDPAKNQRRKGWVMTAWDKGNAKDKPKTNENVEPGKNRMIDLHARDAGMYGPLVTVHNRDGMGFKGHYHLSTAHYIHDLDYNHALHDLAVHGIHTHGEHAFKISPHNKYNMEDVKNMYNTHDHDYK